MKLFPGNHAGSECCSEPTEGAAHSPGRMPTWLYRYLGTGTITTMSTLTVQISLYATYSTTEQPLDSTEAMRAVPYSRTTTTATAADALPLF